MDEKRVRRWAKKLRAMPKVAELLRQITMKHHEIEKKFVALRTLSEQVDYEMIEWEKIDPLLGFNLSDLTDRDMDGKQWFEHDVCDGMNEEICIESTSRRLARAAEIELESREWEEKERKRVAKIQQLKDQKANIDKRLREMGG